MHNPYTAELRMEAHSPVGMYKDTLLICGGKTLRGPSVASALLGNELEAGDAVFLGFVKLVPDRLMVALDEHRQGHRQLLPAWCACVERKCQNATLHRDAQQQVDCPSVPQVGWIIWHLRFLWRIPIALSSSKMREMGAELFLAFFLQFWIFFGFRAWCDLYGVLQVCRMVSA